MLGKHVEILFSFQSKGDIGYSSHKAFRYLFKPAEAQQSMFPQRLGNIVKSGCCGNENGLSLLSGSALVDQTLLV